MAFNNRLSFAGSVFAATAVVEISRPNRYSAGNCSALPATGTLFGSIGELQGKMMKFRLMTAGPSVRAMAFCLLPLACYLLGMLNYSQAGKVALLGFFILTTLFSWRELYPSRRLFTVLLSVTLVLLIADIVFQVTLRQTFGVQQDDVLVVQALLNTNVEEASSFISQYRRYVGWYVVFSVLFLAAYWRLFVVPGRDFSGSCTGRERKKKIIFATIFTLLLLAIHSNSSLRKANPLFYFHYNYQKLSREIEQARRLKDELAKGKTSPALSSMHLLQGVDRKTVVLVIGESDTRNNWSLYGYGRRTTPELEKLREGLLVFKDVLSADGATVGSVTKMLTAATWRNPDIWKSSPTIMAIARHLGFKVFWIANQGSKNRGVVPILAAQADTTIFTNRGMDRGESSLDEVLLAPYRSALADPAEKKLIIVHLLGVHPAYNFRYPQDFGIFEKVYDDPVAEGLKQAGRAPWAILFRNMYDCAILYNDHILSELLRGLMAGREADSAWLYISDHGQDVVHNSDYSGHNIRVKEQWEVPLVVWRSQTKATGGEATDHLVTRPYQADVLDHTILGLLGIAGELYDPELDLLSEKFKQAKILPRRMKDADYD